MPKLTIVKIGGAIIEEREKLLPFLAGFAAIKVRKFWFTEVEKKLMHGQKN